MGCIRDIEEVWARVQEFVDEMTYEGLEGLVPFPPRMQLEAAQVVGDAAASS